MRLMRYFFYLAIFEKEQKKLINLKEVSVWASQYLNRKVTVSNILYLLQYGRIKKYKNDGNTLINIDVKKTFKERKEKGEFVGRYKKK